MTYFKHYIILFLKIFYMSCKSLQSSNPEKQKQNILSCITNLQRLKVKIESGSAAAAAAKSLQLCPTLCNPLDGSPPGSPVPGILQAGVLEWVAIAFSDFRPNNWLITQKFYKMIQHSIFRQFLYLNSVTTTHHLCELRQTTFSP